MSTSSRYGNGTQNVFEFMGLKGRVHSDWFSKRLRWAINGRARYPLPAGKTAIPFHRLGAAPSNIKYNKCIFK